MKLLDTENMKLLNREIKANSPFWKQLSKSNPNSIIFVLLLYSYLKYLHFKFIKEKNVKQEFPLFIGSYLIIVSYNKFPDSHIVIGKEEIAVRELDNKLGIKLTIHPPQRIILSIIKDHYEIERTEMCRHPEL